LSLIAIVTGFTVLRDLSASRVSPAWIGVFIVAAALTSVTGFGFAPRSSRWCFSPA
jgi:hypothetical protein